jgi:aconitate hydratase 2/2-methylisocitrate dehydratase/2-methylcitrate dehydratase
MVAIGLLKGNVTAKDYEDEVALDPRIDLIRDKMQCVELEQYTQDYLDPEKRSIANAIQIFYKDGSVSENVAVEYPIGHKRRRAEGIPKLVEKFKTNLARVFDAKRSQTILDISLDQTKLESMAVNDYVDLYWKG